MIVLDESLDTLYAITMQACCDTQRRVCDSVTVTAYADGLRLLALHGLVKIIAEDGNRVIARPLPIRHSTRTCERCRRQAS